MSRVLATIAILSAAATAFPAPECRIADSKPVLPVRELGTAKFRPGGRVCNVRYLDKNTLMATLSDRVEFIDRSTGKRMDRFAKSDEVIRHACPSPDGKVLAMLMGVRGVVCLRDFATGKLLQTLGDPTNNAKSKDLWIRFSADGKQVRVLEQDENHQYLARIWDTATGTGTTWKGPRAYHYENGRELSQLQSTTFSADGSRMAAVFFNRLGGRNNLTFWHLFGESSDGVQPKLGAGEPVQWGHFEVAPDGRSVLGKATSNNGTTRCVLWNADTGKEMAALEEDPSPMEFAPDGRSFLIATAGQVSIRDAADGQLLHEWKVEEAFGDPFFSRDGKLLVSQNQKIINVWDLRTSKKIRTLETIGRIDLSRGDLCPDGRYFAFPNDCSIGIVDTHTGKTGQEDGHVEVPETLCISPDGSVLASRSSDELFLWDVSSSKLLGQLKWEPDDNDRLRYLRDVDLTRPKRLVAFSRDGQHLAATYGPDIVVYDIATRKELCRMLGHEREVAALVFRGETLVSSGRDQRVCIWRWRTGEKAAEFSIKEDGNSSESGFFRQHCYAPQHCFSADGRMLFVRQPVPPPLMVRPTRRPQNVPQEPEHVAMWEVASGKKRGEFTVQDPSEKNGIPLSFGLTPSADGQHLIVSQQGRIRMWDCAEPKPKAQKIFDIACDSAPIPSPDGKYMAAWTDNASLMLWDIVGGKVREHRGLHHGACLYHEAGHSRAISSLAFSGDGKTVITSGADTVIRFWNVEDLARRADK